MNKYLVMILIALGLVSCSEKNEQYYLKHPKELQQALKTCHDKGQGCETIKQLAYRMNHLARELQYNPQGFGHKILSLQQTIATQELDINKNKAAPELMASLKQNKHELAECLAVVKWLESPES